MIPAEAAQRFRADLEQLTGGTPLKVGVAVSGGPDSLALLLLAAAAYPGQVEVATVDHRLRRESRDEAGLVASACRSLGIPHTILTLDWPDPPGGNIQARAREGRYHVLSNWALDRRIPFLATGHHLDDQAETILLRIARGSGVSGLAGTRPKKLLAFRPRLDQNVADDMVHVVRPLLGWSRDELASLLAGTDLKPIDDPSNSDERFDRTRVRALLARNSDLSPRRLAETASHLAEAEEALKWAALQLAGERLEYRQDGSVTLLVTDLPRELQRRLLLNGFSYFAASDPPAGPKLSRLLDDLRAGRGGTLAGVRVHPGEKWHLQWAPPRRGAPR
jgi:tRNA(Ile)-lysidine synthase